MDEARRLFDRYATWAISICLMLAGNWTAGAICYCYWRYELRLIDAAEPDLSSRYERHD